MNNNNESNKKKLNKELNTLQKKLELNNTIAKFTSFINIHKIDTKNDIENRKNINYTSMTGGSYYIKEKYKDTFYKLYYEAAKNGGHKNLHFTEKNTKYGPYKADFDFKFPLTKNKSLVKYYNDRHIRQIVNIQMRLMKKYLDVPEHLLKAFILERKEPYINEKTNLLSDGIHIVYPLFSMSKTMEYFITYKAKASYKKHKIFDNMPLAINIDKVVDFGVIKNANWTMYGSSKKDKEPYLLTKIFHYTTKINPNNKSFLKTCLNELLDYHKYKNNNNLIRLLSVYRPDDSPDIYKHNSKINIKEVKELVSCLDNEGKIIKKNKKETLLSKVKKQINEKNTTKKEKNDNKNENEDEDENEDENDDDLDKYIQNKKNKFKKYIGKGNLTGNVSNNTDLINKAKFYTSLLSKERSDNWNYWLKVCWILSGIDSSLLDTFIEFSKKSEKYKEGECEYEWNKSLNYTGNRGYSIGTLIMWAKEDSPNEIKKYNDNNIVKYIKESNLLSELSSVKVAQLLYKLYGEHFVCINIKKNVWYKFENHGWDIDDSGTTLYNNIDNEVIKYIQKTEIYMSDEITKKRDQNIESSEYDITQINRNLADLKKNFTKLLEKLSTTSFKNNIIKEAAHKFYIKDFISTLDENKKLLRCANGVIDFTTGKFRPGLPSDRLKLSTKINYKEFAEDDPDIIWIRNFFKKILPNKSVRDYMFRMLSTCLMGDINEETIHFLSGNAGNGKSKLFNFMTYVLGEYAGTLPMTLFTQQQPKANEAMSCLANKKGVRLVVVHELETFLQLYLSLLKQISGNDLISTRDLWGIDFSFYPQMKIFFLVNKKPFIGDDQGAWRRIVDVLFPSKFVENPDPNDRNQHKIDKNLKQKMYKRAEHLLYLLVQEAFVYNKESITIPKSIVISTKKYKSDNDYIAQFINQTLARTSKSDSMPVSNLYNKFKIWYKNYVLPSTNTRNMSGCPNVATLESKLLQENYEIKNSHILNVVCASE